MLLTISTTHRPATDLGFLLHKHPGRVQAFDVSAGTAHVLRGLGHKRSLAAREYALGLEALERAARGEPLWRVHECVFAVLALESEPVDPRL